MGQRQALPALLPNESKEFYYGRGCIVSSPENTQRYRGKGLLILTGSGVYYVLASYKMYRVMELPYTGIEECTYDTGFGCCCSPYTLFHVIGNVQGQRARVSLGLLMAETAVEKINSARRTSPQYPMAMKCLTLPLDHSGKTIDCSDVDKCLIVKNGKTLSYGRGEMFITSRGVCHYVSLPFQLPCKLADLPYSEITECCHIPNLTLQQGGGNAVWANSVLKLTGGKGKHTMEVYLAFDLAHQFSDKITHSMGS